MPLTIGASCGPRLPVVLADGCPAMREGLARLIADECDMVVVNSAATGAELRRVITAEAPGVLLLDLLLDNEDGLALIRDLLAIAPALRIVVFTAAPADVYAVRCVRAGVRAFISKQDSVSALFRAIRSVAEGGIVVPPDISLMLATTKPAPAASATDDLARRLSDRELQVFRLVGQAQPTRAIAANLGVSVKTIETHREHIKDKLGLQSHEELVASAARWLRQNNGA